MISTPEVIFIGLLLAVTSLALVAQYLKVPYPIALVLGGIGLAFVPDLPRIPLKPELIFFLFLPPLLTEAAYFTSIRELQSNVRPIMFLGIGLVFVTSAAIAALFIHIVPGMSLATAFLLGAVVSPPDAVAIAAITKKLHLPRKTMAILEGESLVNDASALVIYKFAIISIVTGYFSFAHASLSFILMILIGLSVGGIFGGLFMRYFHLIRENSIAIATTFIVPFSAYLVAEGLNGSGVLAVVTAGLITAWYAPEKFSPSFRLRSMSVWQTTTFMLNGFVFVLIGLQFPVLLDDLEEYSVGLLLTSTIGISVAVIAVRFLWVYFVAYGIRFLFPHIRAKDPYPPWQQVFVISWSGLRGVISLAAALALPTYLANGQFFPYRDLIIYLAFVVIVVTLVIQGALSPYLIRKLNFPFDAKEERELWHAKVAAIRAALDEIERLKHLYPESGALKRIKLEYEEKLQGLGDGPSSTIFTGKIGNTIRTEEQKLWSMILHTERQKILELRKNKKIGDSVLHKLQNDLDLAHEKNQSTHIPVKKN